MYQKRQLPYLLIRYSECCQKLIGAYPDDLNSNLSTEFQQFHSYIRHRISATKSEQKLDLVMLNKVIVEDNIERLACV